MSLRVWLPLNGDLNNQGLDSADVSITSAQGNIVDNGKIGKCFKTTTTGDISLNNSSKIINTGDMSFGGWFKFNKAEIQTALEAKTYTSSATTATGSLIGNSNYGGFGLIWNSNNMYSSSKVLSSINIFTNIRTSTSSKSTSSFAIDFDVWTHIFVTFNKVTNVLSLYKNGALYSSTTLAEFSDCVDRNICINYKGISGGKGPSASIPFYVNDVRLYDSCLSTKEVKELSKGLVCHYKLDDRYISDNLIINGFGELGNENWTSSTNISTTEIPSNHSEIKASFYNGNMTKEYIPINSNHSYTISAYLKTSGATTGTTYPSICPYDYDKKFIWTYNCSEGFSTQYKTTLAQPLKKGDTVIYATNLNAWTTGNNYYFHVAIFGYKDSSGYTYPDMIYTADSPVFGTKTDKSHIDKTNNIITLKAPFTGEDRPAGTTICQATEGSIYYYPFGGVALANIQDWTLKTATFVPKNNNRLKACKYIRWQAYSGAYYAGIKLIDNNDNSNLIIDSSGYGHHGSKIGELTVSNNSARSSLSTVFNGVDSFIEAEPLPLETKTISIWLKTSWSKPSSGYRLAVHDKNTGLAIGFSSSGMFITYVGSGNGGLGSQIAILSMNYVANQWNHIVIVKTGDTTRDIYVNGVKKTPSGANYWGGDLNKLNIGARHLNSYSAYFDGQMSDFRAYTTALSADDILELYQVGASIDKNGNMFTYEFKED